MVVATNFTTTKLLSPVNFHKIKGLTDSRNTLVKPIEFK